MHTSDALSVHVRRIYSEYLEMPGLRLTCAQAQRLWDLDRNRCLDALRILVDAGFLRTTDSGHYVRLTDGAATTPLPRMAKAESDRPKRTRLTA
jgi:hypothetical protein